MTKELKEKIFDLVLAEALKESMNREFQRIDEMVAAMPEYEPSPETDRVAKKIIKSFARKERIKKLKQICIEVVKVVVIIFTIMGVIFGVLLTQPAVYTAVQDVIRNIFKL